MGKLLDKFNDFKKLNNFVFSYVLDNGTNISFKISQFNFAHLIGIHKLIDLPIVGKFNNPTDYSVTSKVINKLIRNEVITEDVLKSSSHFCEIENRYNFLTSENLLSLSFNEVIINFNRTILRTILRSNYIFVESKNGGYLHLGIVFDGRIYVPETFFFDTTDYYKRNQTVIKIKKITITDSHNKIVLEEDKING